MQLAGTVLYVSDMLKSVEFYRHLFATEPSRQSEGFTLFDLEEGRQLRLWQQDNVEPKLSEQDKKATNNVCELAFNVEGEESLTTLFDKFSSASDILQPLCQMSFGQTFTIADPDGHRLRFMHVEVLA